MKNPNHGILATNNVDIKVNRNMIGDMPIIFICGSGEIYAENAISRMSS